MQIKSGRKLYSLKESYHLTCLAFYSMPDLKNARKQGHISHQFFERIMLAVTEVNGCLICSYAHTKMALEAGMSPVEIQNMLSGEMSNVPAEELTAIMFAQHYAETRGNPSFNAWKQLVEVYGKLKALGILGSIRIIMLGNAYGIPWSSFFNRFKGKPDKRCRLSYELSMIFGSILFVPLALINVLLKRVISKKRSDAYS